MIRLMSFGFKNKQAPPPEAFVFDCRELKNPHFQPALRELDGTCVQVKTFVEKDPGFHDLYTKAKFHALTYPDPLIAFGCYGGKHRSVAMAELLAEDLRLNKKDVAVSHREMVSENT